MKTITPVLFAGLLLSGAAAGADFTTEDANGDGYLTDAEWQDAGYEPGEFSRADRNADGYVSEAEQSEFQASASDAGSVTPEEDYQGTGYDPVDPNPPADDESVSAETEAAASGEFPENAGSAGADESTATYGTVSERQESQSVSLQALDANADGRLSRQEAQADPQLVNTFVVWDVNQDGYLDQSEIDSGQESQPPEDTNVHSERSSFDAQDVDGDGRISRNETGNNAEFDVMDSNRDGYLDETEINYDPAERDISDATGFEDYDANADGRLSREEAGNDMYMDANFDKWDANRDGYLEEEEVNDGWLQESTETSDNEL